MGFRVVCCLSEDGKIDNGFFSFAWGEFFYEEVGYLV